MYYCSSLWVILLNYAWIAGFCLWYMSALLFSLIQGGGWSEGRQSGPKSPIIIVMCSPLVIFNPDFVWLRKICTDTIGPNHRQFMKRVRGLLVQVPEPNSIWGYQTLFCVDLKQACLRARFHNFFVVVLKGKTKWWEKHSWTYTLCFYHPSIPRI